jgi:uncharacterized protein (TIGR03083 family)
VQQEQPVDVLRSAYAAFAEVVGGLGEEESWLPSGCTGWALRDLVFHCLADAQRALVALHTPARGPVDRDAVTYWSDWQPGSVGAAHGRRYVRVGASMFLIVDQLKESYLETAAAAVTAAANTDPHRLIATQGHVLTAGDLMRTLTLEATVHHLDLVAHLPSAASPAGDALADVRTTLDGLLGRTLPLNWDDRHYALAATGRRPLTPAERKQLGADAQRLPLLG